MLPPTRHTWTLSLLRHLALATFAASLAWTSALPAAEVAPAPLATLTQQQQPQVDLFRKRPYLIYPGDPSRMTVLWQLTATDSSTIEWGVNSSYSGGSIRTGEYGPDHQHKVTIADLIPSQHYLYRVTVQGVSYGGAFTAAPVPSATRVKFVAYGDTRSNPSAHDQVAAGMIATWNADPAYQSFALVVGDLVANGDREADWDSQFFDPAYDHIQELLASVPYLSCMGNHEGSGALFTKYFPYPFVQARYWSYNYGPAHVVVVDQFTNYGPGSPQLDWITRDLAASNKPWKFICLHEPGWSAGGGHENNSSVQDVLQPLCVQYGVSIVFGGHNHYYARAVVDGVQHITAGGGGAPLYVPDPSYPNVVASASTYGFCTIDVDGGVLHFRALRPDGAQIDSFTVRQPTAVALSDISAEAGSDYVDLRWSAFLDAPASFQVLRSSRADADYARVSEEWNSGPGAQDFTWRDVSVSAATDYYYKIGWREDGDWNYSGSVRVVTTAAKFRILAIAPNPLGRGASRIEFELANAGRARLEICDVAGRRVCTLLDGRTGAGRRAVVWEGRDDKGRPLSAGVYIARLSSGAAATTRKVVLAR